MNEISHSFFFRFYVDVIEVLQFFLFLCQANERHTIHIWYVVVYKKHTHMKGTGKTRNYANENRLLFYFFFIFSFFSLTRRCFFFYFGENDVKIGWELNTKRELIFIESTQFIKNKRKKRKKKLTWIKANKKKSY